MAVSTIPKSEARYNESLYEGFATLPPVEMDDGTVCWALPGGHVICDPEEALKEASKLDLMIREGVKKTGRVLH